MFQAPKFGCSVWPGKIDVKKQRKYKVPAGVTRSEERKYLSYSEVNKAPFLSGNIYLVKVRARKHSMALKHDVAQFFEKEIRLTLLALQEQPLVWQFPEWQDDNRGFLPAREAHGECENVSVVICLQVMCHDTKATFRILEAAIQNKIWNLVFFFFRFKNFKLSLYSAPTKNRTGPQLMHRNFQLNRNRKKQFCRVLVILWREPFIINVPAPQLNCSCSVHHTSQSILSPSASSQSTIGPRLKQETPLFHVSLSIWWRLKAKTWLGGFFQECYIEALDFWKVDCTTAVLGADWRDCGLEDVGENASRNSPKEHLSCFPH